MIPSIVVQERNDVGLPDLLQEKVSPLRQCPFAGIQLGWYWKQVIIYGLQSNSWRWELDTCLAQHATSELVITAVSFWGGGHATGKRIPMYIHNLPTRYLKRLEQFINVCSRASILVKTPADSFLKDSTVGLIVLKTPLWCSSDSPMDTKVMAGFRGN